MLLMLYRHFESPKTNDRSDKKVLLSSEIAVKCKPETWTGVLCDRRQA